MTNAVYSMTVRALSGVVSDRAAEMMLRAVLREQGYAPESVTAGEMQSLLSGPLLERLTLAMPPVQARQTLQRLSAQLAAQYPKAPTLFLEQQPVAAWDDAPEITGTRWEDLELGADDFEFEDPEYVSAPQGHAFDLGREAEQEELLRSLARVSGVQGVLLCRASGEVVRERALKEGVALGAVVAATALLFQKRSLRLMAAEVGGRTVCMRPLGAFCVAVVAGPSVNVGRLLVELQGLQVSA